MKLMEYVEESYENARPGTIDFCLSEYLLMHVFEIDELSLADISKATGIGKSTVATYFNSETIPGGYVAFKKALSTELGRNVLTIKNHMKWARGLIQDLKKYMAISENDANDLCQRMLSSGKVVFIGPKIYRDSMVTLISFLRFRGIPSRYILDSCMQRYEEEFLTMKEEDLVIFLLPNKTYTEYHLELVAKASYANAYKNCAGTKIYICGSKDINADKTGIIPFYTRNNPYEKILSVIHLSAFFFQKCVEMSGVDINERIYVF